MTATATANPIHYKSGTGTLVDALRTREIFHAYDYGERRVQDEAATIFDCEYMKRRLELSHELRGHDGCVNAIQWDPSGRWLVSGSGNH